MWRAMSAWCLVPPWPICSIFLSISSTAATGRQQDSPFQSLSSFGPYTFASPLSLRMVPNSLRSKSFLLFLLLLPLPHARLPESLLCRFYMPSCRQANAPPLRRNSENATRPIKASRASRPGGVPRVSPVPASEERPGCAVPVVRTISSETVLTNRRSFVFAFMLRT